MGDMADAILNGDMDEQTGEWLGNGQGFPRTLNENNTYSAARTNSHAINGVRHVTKQYLSKKLYNLFILDYGKNQLGIKSNQIADVCLEIQKDFSKYVNYLKANYSNYGKTKSTL